MRELKHLNTANETYYLKDNGNIEVHIKLNSSKTSLQKSKSRAKAITNAFNSAATYISKKNPDTNYNKVNTMKVGVSSDDTYRSLLKLDLPEIGTAYNLVSAKLCLFTHHDDHIKDLALAEGLVTVNELSENVDFGKVTWNNFNDKYVNNIEFYTPILRSTFTPSGIKSTKNEFDITNLVKKWYSGGKNNGLLIKNYSENYDKEVNPFTFYTAYSDEDGNLSPCLEFELKEFNGLENYLTYQSYAGSGYACHINNLTGNLINVVPLNRTILGKSPISISMYYNTNDCLLNKDNAFVKGFKLNYYSYLKETENNVLTVLSIIY